MEGPEIEVRGGPAPRPVNYARWGIVATVLFGIAAGAGMYILNRPRGAEPVEGLGMAAPAVSPAPEALTLPAPAAGPRRKRPDGMSYVGGQAGPLSGSPENVPASPPPAAAKAEAAPSAPRLIPVDPAPAGAGGAKSFFGGKSRLSPIQAGQASGQGAGGGAGGGVSPSGGRGSPPPRTGFAAGPAAVPARPAPAGTLTGPPAREFTAVPEAGPGSRRISDTQRALDQALYDASAPAPPSGSQMTGGDPGGSGAIALDGKEAHALSDGQGIKPIQANSGPTVTPFNLP